MEYTVGKNVFGNWIIKNKLGEGASGQVFEIHKEDGTIAMKAALKVISVPKSEEEIRQLLGEGMDRNRVGDYFNDAVKEIEKEITTMVELRSHPAIVRFEDYVFVPHPAAIGGDILIRMELLQSLSEYMISNRLDEKRVLQMAKELCSALVYCHKRNMIHRDIKPENIFVSEMGQFKLGDFGLTKTVEQSMGVLSKKGTESYMAPEVYLGKSYNQTADIYSLGLVLYKSLNQNRLPFFPLTAVYTFADREQALNKRMQGAELPRPADAGEKLGNIILKACAFEPARRYQTAEEMLRDLELAEGGQEEGKEAAPAQKKVRRDIGKRKIKEKKIKQQEVHDKQEKIGSSFLPIIELVVLTAAFGTKQNTAGLMFMMLFVFVYFILTAIMSMEKTLTGKLKKYDNYLLILGGMVTFKLFYDTQDYQGMGIGVIFMIIGAVKLIREKKQSTE